MPRPRFAPLGAALIGAVLLLPPVLSADVAIARRGTAEARIVVDAAAGPVDVRGAEELAFFLHIVTGGEFPIARSAAALPAGAPRLLVGGLAARAADPAFDAARLAPEEIVIRSAGSDLILAGGGIRGTIYAVYAFLEDVVGCRWWTPTASRIPLRPTLALGPVDIRFKPPLEYREPFWYTAFDPSWAARNKMNGIQAGGDEERGGHQIYEGFVHTFYRLIPPEKYFKDHPEWFSLVGGQRTDHDAQLCLTNEEMRKELVKNLKDALRANPKATIASVSQNDCFHPCECPACKAVEAEEGSPSGPLLRFVNAVAADIAGEFPNVAIDTLAYQYTRKAPKLVRPLPNVIVRLCSIECSFSRPLDDAQNADFFADLQAWSKVAGRLYVWDYTTDFSHYIQPQPNLQVLAPNIRLFVGNSVRGIFEQGAYQSWGSEMAELRGWMLAKLLWNPGLDPRRLREEFLDGYYGPAAGPIGRYLELMESAVLAAGDKLGCYSPPEAKFLSLERLTAAWDLLGRAERRVAGTIEYARRVLRAKMPVAYVALTRWDDLRKSALAGKADWPWPATREELLDWFVGSARAENVTMISEDQTFDDWAAKKGNKR